jgi:hypothetical protein
MDTHLPYKTTQSKFMDAASRSKILSIIDHLVVVGIIISKDRTLETFSWQHITTHNSHLQESPLIL